MAAKVDQPLSSEKTRERHLSGGDSKFHRRMSRPDLRLDFSNIPRYTSTAIPIIDRTEEEGCMLFRDFLREQLDHRELDVPNRSILTPSDRVAYGCRNPGWIILRRHMLQMGATFESTKQRLDLHQKCLCINAQDIEEEAFCDILKGLFTAEGERKENIVALYVFCSDFILQTLTEENSELFDKFLKWTLHFIAKEVCPWVRDNGGWDQVLDNSFQHFPKIVAVATIALLAVMSFRLISRRL